MMREVPKRIIASSNPRDIINMVMMTTKTLMTYSTCFLEEGSINREQGTNREIIKLRGDQGKEIKTKIILRLFSYSWARSF